MRRAIAIFGLMLFQPLLAVEAPQIDSGDYLFVYARIVDCGPELQAIDFGQVDVDGVVTLFRDVSVIAKGRPVHKVRNELVDVLERRTGHRSQSLDLVHVSGGDEEAVAKRLVSFAIKGQQRCAPIVLPPGDLDPNWAEKFERIVHSAQNKRSRRDTSGAGPA